MAKLKSPALGSFEPDEPEVVDNADRDIYETGEFGETPKPSLLGQPDSLFGDGFKRERTAQPRLETDLSADFAAWKKNPSREASAVMLTKLQPTINRGLQTYLGNNVSPNLRAKAKQMALQALATYDPQKSKLSTHVINHLQGLRRASRRSQQVLSVPERVSYDRALVAEQSAQLRDETGRDPSALELADRTGLSVKRLKYLEQFHRPVAEGTLDALVNEEGESGGFSPTIVGGKTDTYLELLYHDLDGTNQKILEWSTGLHGSKVIPNQLIAKKLGISPGAVSQRRATLQSRLDELQEMNIF